MSGKEEAPRTQDSILEVRNISKKFGGIQALQEVNLQMRTNEVLALLGDNGAGKSTLIKIISGAYKEDRGEIFVRGKKVKIRKPKDSQKLGIKTIYQDLALFGVLDIPSNLFMGQEMSSRLGFTKIRQMKKESYEIMCTLKIQVKSLKQKVMYLSGGQQHAVAIGKAVYIGRPPEILIMDEPTAGLGAQQSNEVLNLIRNLKKEGLSIILISHNLNHVFAVADRAAILFNGKLIAYRKIEETNQNELVGLMLGGS